MTVNGRARWTCRTHVEAVAGDGALETRRWHLPVIRDLATDMSLFFDKGARAMDPRADRDAT
jgi:fumarate reductase iron-sulfur subunit